MYLYAVENASKNKNKKISEAGFVYQFEQNILSYNVNNLEIPIKCKHRERLPWPLYFHSISQPEESILVNETWVRLY